ncbi:MAG TPA: CHAT domain-containing protein [Pyrinomonadaceae bacterium]|nr:CHAT domain-containing protein [Pyrinomonadaceae bacterium]
MAVYDPLNQRVADRISTGYEVLEIALPTSAAGAYRLEVISREHRASRRYQLKVESLRPATIEDRKLNTAQQIVATGDFLRLEWTENSLRQALASYDTATALLVSSKQLRQAAFASMRAGETCFVLGDYHEALKRFEKAATHAKKTQTPIEEARALTQIARLHSALGNSDRAEECLAKALNIIPQSNASTQFATVRHVRAEALISRGEINYAKGDLVKSLEDFNHALNLSTDVSDRRGQARSHLFKGYIASIGDSEKAFAEISEALNLFQAVADKSGEGLCLTALGLYHSQKQRADQAMGMHRQAGDIFRAIGDRQSEAITLNAMGQAYEFLKDYSMALESYKRALAILQNTGFVDIAASSMFKVARTYRVIKDFDQALVHYRECLKLSRAAKKWRTEANALNDMATIYATQGNQRETTALYQRLLKSFAGISDRRGQATTLNNLGDVLLRFKQPRRALRAFEQALPLSEGLGDPAISVSTLYNLARANRALGNFYEALSSIERSISTIENLRSNVKSPEFRTSYFAGVQEQYDLHSDLLMQLDRIHPNCDFAARAFSVSDSARARSLRDRMADSEADIPSDASPALLERRRELLGLIRAQGQYALELSMKKHDAGESEGVSRQLKELRSEYLDIEAQIRKPTPGFGALSQQQPLTVAQIQTELLDDDSILLEFSLGDERSYLWAVTKKTFHSYELPRRAVLETKAFEVYKLVTERQVIGANSAATDSSTVFTSDRIYQEEGLELSRMLLGPAAEQLGAKRIIVVTEGVLQYIPFDALPDPRVTRAASSQAFGGSGDPPPLLAAHEIVMLPSISTLAAIRRQHPRVAASDKVVAVLADPVFNRDDDRVKNPNSGSIDLTSAVNSPLLPVAVATRSGSYRGFMRLLHSAKEADEILAVTPRGKGIAIQGFDARRETAINVLAADYKIVHFATHSFINNEHPELSGIVLSMVNKDGSKAQGFMPLRDIYSLNGSADLVVLSACDTALGKDITGEGLVGLTYGFMSAGSKTVVASLWKVDDRATAALMSRFYKSMLQDGMKPVAALKSAKEHVRRQKGWEAPYFWAGFVLQGEYADNVVDPSTFHNLNAAFVLVLTLPLFLFGLHLIHKRRRRASPR